MYSFSDLLVLYNLYVGTNVDYRNKIVFMLKNSDGTIYALKINDHAKLRNSTRGKIQELINKGIRK